MLSYIVITLSHCIIALIFKKSFNAIEEFSLRLVACKII